MADTQTYPKVKRQISLPNDIETIPQLNEFIDTVAEEIGLEEAVVNVMEYAYPPGSQETLQIEMGCDGEQLTFVISDHGVPFDPTQQAEADTTLSVEERSIGGLGIHLVRQIMDTISYERTDGFNVLTLRKKLLTT